jgi:Ser/Thr protein kinase RdoA (MazF antagonist)
METYPDMDYEQLARQALMQYKIKDASLSFLQHSDTATFLVDSGRQGRFLLRIHVPFTPEMGQHGSDPAMLRSELLWLEALRRSTDLILQHPRRNQDGDFVTTLPTESGPINVTMLGWLEGEKFPREMESEETAAQMGAIAAKLHRHASHWRLPPGFTRPSRDAAYFQGMLNQLKVAVDDGRIEYLDYKTLETATESLLQTMTTHRNTRQSHGLIHADLHRGNMLLQDGQVRVIDFSFCAFGDFMFDLGICLSNIRQEFHPAFLAGYEQYMQLPADFARQIEGFYIGSMLGTLVFMLNRPDLQENFVRRASILSKEYAARFNLDERFWFTNWNL